MGRGEVTSIAKKSATRALFFSIWARYTLLWLLIKFIAFGLIGALECEPFRIPGAGLSGFPKLIGRRRDHQVRVVRQVHRDRDVPIRRVRSHGRLRGAWSLIWLVDRG